MSIRNRYEPANQRLDEFLTTIGRRKFIKPLYEELAKTRRAKSARWQSTPGGQPIIPSP
jgi:hypothetical protein